MVRCYSFMKSTTKGGGVITKFWIILQMVVDGILGGGILLELLTSTNPKSIYLPFQQKLFFTFFFYSASLRLILQLICSSIKETQRVRQPFIKVSLGSMCSFFCQFYYRLENTVRFNEKKSYCISVLILLLIFLGKIPKHHLLKVEGGLCKSIAVQRGGQHCMVIGWVRIFDFSSGRQK